jgi:small subunit ribosomal protein S6
LRQYELLFIISPKVVDQDIDKLVHQVRDHLTGMGAEILNLQKMGRRRLAYEIDRAREGYYVLIQFKGTGAEIPELERRLRVIDDILRYLTVRMDEDMRRMNRMKQARARRTSRKAHAGAARDSLPEQAFEGPDNPGREES